MPWALQPQLVWVESHRLATKEHDKYNDNNDKAMLTMTEMTATATTTAAMHGDGNHVDDEKSNNTGDDGVNDDSEEDSRWRQRQQRQ